MSACDAASVSFAGANTKTSHPAIGQQTLYSRKTAFLGESIFNGGEVQYLTVLRDDVFSVYWSDDVVTVMADAFEVVNSVSHGAGQYDAQKVLFRRDNKNAGELEMRNDSEKHYGEVRFNMNREPCLALLDAVEIEKQVWLRKVQLYGQAARTFGKWPGALSSK